jgi:integrase
MDTSSAYSNYTVFVESKALRSRSKEEYLRQIRKLADHYHNKSLYHLSERAVFDYLIHLRDVRKFRPSTLNQAVVALRLFYRDYVGLQWVLWDRFEIRRDQPLPVVLSRNEVASLLNAARDNRFKAVFVLIYHCGLRVGEAVRLRPTDIDDERGVLRILDGKGGRNREIPIAQDMIVRLRRFCAFHGNRHWLFPGLGRNWRDRAHTLKAAMHSGPSHMSVASVQNALRMVLKDSGIQKKATCHSLRHSFATHLLEDGVSIRQVSTYLGHASIQSTLIYLHVTEISEAKGRDVQARLLDFVLNNNIR